MSSEIDCSLSENISVIMKSNSDELDKKKDDWEVQWEVKQSIVPSFSKMNAKQRTFHILFLFFLVILTISLLYFFIVLLELLGTSFQLLASSSFKTVFEKLETIENPLAGLSIGILLTVLLQSSSASTSIFVSLAATDLSLEKIVYLIMGANIGTSVTNSFVSMSQYSSISMFKRAFAGATIHDMFNFLTVFILLPIEYISSQLTPTKRGFLVWLADLSISSIPKSQINKINFLKNLTSPLTNKIVQRNNSPDVKLGTKCNDPSTYFLFCGVNKNVENYVGLILFILCLVFLTLCLLGLVNILKYSLEGKMIVFLHKAVNAKIPYPFSWLKDYILILVGFIITFLVQSSSITTSTLVPLVGVGLLTLEAAYAISLGANIGTTFTSILASLSQKGPSMVTSLTASFLHLYFNVFGMLIWFVIPFMRKVPLIFSMKFGKISSKQRWFPLVYIITTFFLAPIFCFLICLLPKEAQIFFFSLFGLIFVLIIIYLELRKLKPKWLPCWLKDFYWLPTWFCEPEFLKKRREKAEEKEKLNRTKTKKITQIERIYQYFGPLNTLENIQSTSNSITENHRNPSEKNSIIVKIES